MERVRIKAREKSRNRSEEQREAPADAVLPTRDGSEPHNFTRSITVRYGTSLYGTIQNIIESAHAAQDFTFLSPSDFVRSALSAYKDGMPLTELDLPGQKQETKLRVDNELYQFYQSLPKGVRSKLLERAIRTFMRTI